jgi:hypothetical protein
MKVRAPSPTRVCLRRTTKGPGGCMSAVHTLRPRAVGGHAATRNRRAASCSQTYAGPDAVRHGAQPTRACVHSIDPPPEDGVAAPTKGRRRADTSGRSHPNRLTRISARSAGAAEPVRRTGQRHSLYALGVASRSAARASPKEMRWLVTVSPATPAMGIRTSSAASVSVAGRRPLGGHSEFGRRPKTARATVALGRDRAHLRKRRCTQHA